MVLRTIVTPWNQALDLMRLKTRFRQMIRRPWKIRLRKPSVGWTQIKLQRKRSSRRSRRSWKVLPYQSCKRWVVELEVCQEECPGECPEECQTWEVLEELHQLKTQQVGLPLRRLTKNI